MADLAIADAILEVRRRINEPSEKVILDTEITEWLHRGARNVSAITLCNTATTGSDSTFVQNTFRYPITSDFIKLDTAIRIKSDGSTELEGLQRIHPRHTGHVGGGSTPGTPKFWFNWHEAGQPTYINYLYTYPTASSTAATGSSGVRIRGYLIVDDYGDGDQLPDWANNLAILYAVACAHIKEGKHAKAAVEIQRYMNAVMNARRIFYESNQVPDTADMRKLPDTKIYPERQ